MSLYLYEVVNYFLLQYPLRLLFYFKINFMQKSYKSERKKRTKDILQ